MKKLAIILASIGAAAGATFVGWQAGGARAVPTPARQGNAQAEAKAPPVTVAPAIRAPMVESVAVTGTLVPRTDVLVGPEIEGLRIVEVLADEGDRVEKGAVLVRLQRDVLDAQLAQSDAALARSEASIAQAQSQIAQAQANAEWTRGDLARSQSLLKGGASTQAQVEQKTSASTSAQAQLQAAKDGLRAAQAERKSIEAQRRELMVRVERTQVRTPAAGLVARRNAKLGAVASAAGEPLFRVIENGEIELEAEIPEARLSALREGQQAFVTLTDGVRAPARVRLVSPEVDRLTRLGRVRISLGALKEARVGAFARGEIEVRRGEAVTVPASALNYDAEGASVLVADSGLVRNRRVTLGALDGGRAEIRQGVKEGEEVVVRAGAFLRDGDAVTPVQMRAEAR